MLIKQIDDFERVMEAAADGTATAEERSSVAACMIAVAVQVLDIAPRESAAWLRAIADDIERRSARTH